jgi:hypothetical protein
MKFYNFGFQYDNINSLLFFIFNYFLNLTLILENLFMKNGTFKSSSKSEFKGFGEFSQNLQIT